MLVQFLRRQLAVELALYLLLGWLFRSLGGVPLDHIILLALGTAVLIRLWLVTLMFLWARAYRAHQPLHFRIGLLQACRLFVTEFASLSLLYTVLQPAEPWLARRRPFARSGRPALPVLFIHGYFCNSAYWWALERYLRRRGLDNLHFITLNPVLADIDDYARQLAVYVEVVCARTGADRVILVGHSMGGLVARAYVQHAGGDRRVVRIITLGSPHQGSALSRLSALQGPNVRQMAPRSAWLTALDAGEAQSPVPITSMYSCHDNLIAPHNSSVLDHAHVHNVAVPGVGHLAMVFSPLFQKLVHEEILAAAAMPVGSMPVAAPAVPITD